MHHCSHSDTINQIFLQPIIFFYCFSSDLYPVNTHFFCITAQEKSKTYAPITTAILDIPTAWAFFGQNPEATSLKLHNTVKKVAAEWNSAHADKRSVNFQFNVGF